MSKKYVPSGYQIINLDVSDKTSGTAFTPETEDEKLLYEILTSTKYNQKPILLKVGDLTGFAILQEDSNVSITGIYKRETISLSGSPNELVWEEEEF